MSITNLQDIYAIFCLCIYSLLDTTHERVAGQNESSEDAVNEKEGKN